jgi:hypothetical protein
MLRQAGNQEQVVPKPLCHYSYSLALFTVLCGAYAQAQTYNLDVGVWGGGGCCNDSARGYWFVAPADFTIAGLSVPTNGTGVVATLEVIRFDAVPPEYSDTTNDFTQPGFWSGVTSVVTNIPVSDGDIIGVFGWAVSQTPYRDQEGPYITNIGVFQVTLNRLLFQSLGAAVNVSSELASDIGVIGLEYRFSSLQSAPKPIPTLNIWGLAFLGLFLAYLARRRISS